MIYLHLHAGNLSQALDAAHRQVAWVDVRLRDLALLEQYLDQRHGLTLSERHRAEIQGNQLSFMYECTDQYMLLSLVRVNVDSEVMGSCVTSLIITEDLIVAILADEAPPSFEAMEIPVSEDGVFSVEREKLMFRLLMWHAAGYAQLKNQWALAFLEFRKELITGAKTISWLSLASFLESVQKAASQCDGFIDILGQWRENDRLFFNRKKIKIDVVEARLNRVGNYFQLIESKMDSLISIFYARQGNQTNDILRILGVISGVFLPLMFLASFFGMNFDKMPLIHSATGFYITLVAMLLVSVSLWSIFKYKKWF